MAGARTGQERSAGSFDELLGLEVLELGEDIARGRIVARDAVKQPMGLTHGGVYAAMAESLAARATQRAVGDGPVARGLATHTSFLRPIFDGTIHAVGRPRHRGRTTRVWEFDVTDDGGRLCALVRATVRIVPGAG